jgi:predicted KAP-like P-loop ATPase
MSFFLSQTLIAPIANLATGGTGGEVAATFSALFGDMINVDESVEAQHKKLADALRNQTKKFLIIIDDIDRLTPDEALLVFKFIKSVGRLPNVYYLLAFDRALVERVISEHFPSEGPHYLEKIVQAPFELPAVPQSDLLEGLLNQIGDICGRPTEDMMVRFMNVFYDVVAPNIRTPRDAVRLSNALTVTWPAVAGEVDAADFVALEAWRVFRPSLYRTVRASRELLCKQNRPLHRQDDIAAEYDATLLSAVGETERDTVKTALKRLFPRLEGVWGNTYFGEEWIEIWQRSRLVCVRPHFDTYFRFGLSDEVVPQKKVSALIERAADREFVTNEFRIALSEHRRTGATRASLLMDELRTRADEVAENAITSLLTTLFALGDELDRPEDEARGFSLANNRLRLHWLTRRLLRDRFQVERRSEILLAAAGSAALGWLVDITSSCLGQHDPRPRNEACLSG